MLPIRVGGLIWWLQNGDVDPNGRIASTSLWLPPLHRHVRGVGRNTYQDRHDLPDLSLPESEIWN
jgi:hypothetical protein